MNHRWHLAFLLVACSASGARADWSLVTSVKLQGAVANVSPSNAELYGALTYAFGSTSDRAWDVMGSVTVFRPFDAFSSDGFGRFGATVARGWTLGESALIPRFGAETGVHMGGSVRSSDGAYQTDTSGLRPYLSLSPGMLWALAPEYGVLLSAPVSFAWSSDKTLVTIGFAVSWRQ